MTRVILKAAAVIAIIYVALMAAMYFGQSRLLFIPTRDLYRTPAVNGWEFDDVSVEVDGETTTGWYIRAEPPGNKVFLFSHGNAGNMADRLESCDLIRRMGYDVLVYDYGGYGASTGSASEERCYADIRGMWGYLTEERGMAPDDIVLFGRSLGAGPTCQLATEVDAHAVIIESAFLSVPQMAQELYPIFPAKWLARHRFDNASKVGAIAEPILVVHSPDDSIIPYSHGERLFALATEPKAFLEIHGDHNEGFWQTGDAYIRGVREFVEGIQAGETPAPPG